jgi:hypothetical protein
VHLVGVIGEMCTFGFTSLSVAKFYVRVLPTCDTFWGVGEGATGSCWGNLRERIPAEDLGIEGWIILKLILNRLGGRGLDMYMDNLQAVVNAVMKFSVP